MSTMYSGQCTRSALQSQPRPKPRGTMNARFVIPALAAACVSLLSCDRVPTADRNPGRPSFITDGTVDGNAHPAVVLIIMDIAGKPAFRCSGTVIAPKLVLTAGHCAGEPGEFSVLLSNNASTGGTCFGGSGGPNYVGSSNVIGAVTSFGLNGNCAGTGGVFRVDRKNVLDFVGQYLK